MGFSLSKDSFTLWLEHPITKELLRSLEERRNKESTSFIKSIKLNDEQYTIERNLYRLVGQQEILNKLIDKETLRDTILSNIEWFKESN